MRKTAYGVKLRQKQRQYRTGSSSVLGIHVLIENRIFSDYQVLFLLLNDPQIEKIDQWCQKSATLWVCPLPKKKKGQSVAQHRQMSFCYFTPSLIRVRPVWSESSLSALRKLGSLATHWVHSEDSDQTGRILGAQSFCWFCHGAAHTNDSRLKGYSR